MLEKWVAVSVVASCVCLNDPPEVAEFLEVAAGVRETMKRRKKRSRRNDSFPPKCFLVSHDSLCSLMPRRVLVSMSLQRNLVARSYLSFFFVYKACIERNGKKGDLGARFMRFGESGLSSAFLL